MKKQFDLQAWLADKSQKVETRDGRPARIICTDAKADDGACIIALIPGYGGEEAYQFFPNGRAFSSKSSDEDCADLFLVTPEPELTKFEEEVCTVSNLCLNLEMTDEVRSASKQLLELAKDELRNQGYTVEKHNAQFDDCVAKVPPETMKEVSDEVNKMLKQDKTMFEAAMLRYLQEGTNAKSDDEIVELTKKHSAELLNIAEKELETKYSLSSDIEHGFAYDLGKKAGKEEALKDLPRWKKAKRDMRVVSRCIVNWDGEIDTSNHITKDSYYIPVSDLEKLPGFKEE